MDYKTFQHCVGEDLIQEFKSLDAVVKNPEYNDEYFKLYKMWKFFNKDDIAEADAVNCQEGIAENDTGCLKEDITEDDAGNHQEGIAEDDTGGLEEDITEDDAGNFQEVDAAGSEDPQLVKTPYENAYFDAVVDDHVLDKENVDSEIKAHPAVKSTEINRIHIIANVVIKAPDTPTVSTPSSNTVILPSKRKSISAYLEVPEPPQKKNKRMMKRIPFAITPNAYQEMHEKKRALLSEEDKKKLEKKQKREASLMKKRNLVDKKKLNIVKTNNCLGCQKCLIKSNFLTCDSCKNGFHPSFIPKNHKQHIPDIDDSDPFMCHNCYKEESEEDADEKDQSDQDADKKEESKEDDTKMNENEEKEIDDLYNMSFHSWN